jgi:large subunit ribosomal protein L3
MKELGNIIYMNTFFGFKTEMTQTWDKNGKRLPVTVVEVKPIVVTQVKTLENDGYPAIQVGIGSHKAKHTSQAVLHHLKKTRSDMVPRYLREVRLNDEAAPKVGDSLKADAVLTVGDLVMVTGLSKGRGFAGNVKRHGFKGGPRTHGQSDRERAPGAIGQGTSPGRIHKGKRMAGHMGVTHFAIKNLRVINLEPETGLLWLSGPVPGSRHSLLTLEKTGHQTL